MQSGAIPYLVYRETHSPSMVGLAGFIAFFPSMLATVPGGQLADRFSKLPYLATIQAVRAVVTGLLCLAAVLDGHDVVVLLVFLGVLSFLLGLGISGFQTVVTELVTDDRHQPRAINLNSAQAQVAKAVGPAAAGAVLAHLGPEVAFGINAFGFGVLALGLALLARGAPRPPARRSGSSGGSVAAIWRHPTRRLATLLAAITMALGTPVYGFISVLADDRWHVGATMYGLLLAVHGAGSVAGNVLIGHLRARRSHVVIGATCAYGAAIATLSSVTVLPVVMLAIAVAGIGYLLIAVTLMTAVQLCTPAPIRGRVTALYSFAAVGGTPIGSLAQGWLADRVGMPWTLGLAGSGLIAVATWLLTSRRTVAVLDGPDHQEAIAPEVTIDLRDRRPSARPEGAALSVR